jgi:hypothetical protein
MNTDNMNGALVCVFFFNPKRVLLCHVIKDVVQL